MGYGGSSKAVKHEWLAQPHTHPDNKLCAFYALHHFTDGKVTKNAFIDKATSVYTDIGLPKEDALAMVLDGNDPATLGQFGLKEGNDAALQQKGVGIVANTDKGHFFTVRQENGKWYSYDSYNHKAPKEYATFADLKKAEIGNSGVWVGT
ncbi:hypothetical protein [Cystobacter fuscus]|uniref:hypothetical protein n=1 Tax=Cystobacter fuscus TaxID=43 RepID=UPI002B315D11|nr:hypothetical protein F0U63_40445 [Cystobacter fuscus]